MLLDCNHVRWPFCNYTFLVFFVRIYRNAKQVVVYHWQHLIYWILRPATESPKEQRLKGFRRPQEFEVPSVVPASFR